MTKKRSPSRLGTNMPVTRGLSTLFGGAAAEQSTVIESDIMQEVTRTTEKPNVTQVPDKTATKETPGTLVTAATQETTVTPDLNDVPGIPATAKVPKIKKLKKIPPLPAANVAVGGGEFTPTRGLPPGWERHTYVIQTKHVELIEAAAYWGRMDKKDILREALDAFFKGRKVKPLPQEKRRERKARSTTKK